MAKKSLPDVSAKFVADVEGMIRDLKRADDATRNTTGSIDREVDKLGKNISKKFSAAKIGESVLQGLGLGSGFAAVNLVVDKFVALWTEADVKAKEAQVSIEKLNDTFRELNRLTQESAIERLLPEQQIEARKKALAELDKKIREQSDEQAALMKDMGALHDAPRGFISGSAFDPLSGRYGYGKNAKTLGDEISDKSDVVTKEIAAAYRKRLELVKQIQAAEAEIAKASEKDNARQATAGWAGLKMQEDAFDAMVSVQKKANDTTEEVSKKTAELVEKYRDLADPIRQYRQQLEDVNRLQSDGRLKANDAAKAIERINDAIFEARFGKPGEKPSDFDADEAVTKLKKVSAGAKAMEEELNAMWNSVSDRAGQAFADMVLTGEAAFSDLVNVVARSVVEMAARLAIINPILNGVFGLAGNSLLPAFFGAGAQARADGGPVVSGQTYLVGEEGPELFTAGNTGTIIPNHAFSFSRVPASQGGNSYFIDARGADAGAVSRIESALKTLAGPGVVERRALSAMFESRRRGTSMA